MSQGESEAVRTILGKGLQGGVTRKVEESRGEGGAKRLRSIRDWFGMKKNDI